MRISTQQQYFKSIDQMQNSQSKLAELQDQISTGKKLQTPSDDPVAAAQVVKLERELAQYEKYDENINVTERRLDLEESILDDINIAIDRLRELTLQAGNGTLQDQDRKAISNEMMQLAEYMSGLMNTQDSQGEYLFAGSRGTTKPYALENGRYEYKGDDGQRQIQVGSELYVASNDSGNYLFEAVDDRLSVQMTGSSVTAGTAFVSIPPVLATYTTDFESIENENKYKEATKGLGDITINVSASDEYTITDSGGNQLVAATPIVAGATIDFFGLQFSLPADGVDDSITLTVSAEKKNVLDVAMDLAEVLATPVVTAEERAALNEAVATSLDQFKQASERNNEAVATLGSRLSTLEFMSSANLDFKLFTESALSSLVDTDMASAISKFKLEETTLEAAQAVFGRVSNLSLFNYIQ